MKALWLDRALFLSPLHYSLATTPKIFKKLLDQLGVEQQSRPEFVKNAHSNATVWHFEKDGKACSIVCLHVPDAEVSPIQIAALLVHEAVHIWQEVRERVGEVSPSREFEAYAIQTISQSLMFEYSRQAFGGGA